MIDLELYLAFVFVSAGLIITPGPNVFLIIATSLSKGTEQGLQTVLGTTSAMIVQLAVVAFGMTRIATDFAHIFATLKLVGVALLLCLGVASLAKSVRAEQQEIELAEFSGGSFFHGFVLSISNPKTMLFFAAFLPQFTSSAHPMGPQMFVLSVSFVAVAVVFDSAYAVTSGAVRSKVSDFRTLRASQGVVGVLYLASGLGLAMIRRT